MALPMNVPRSSPARISGIPSRARIRIDPSADTEALRVGRFDEHEVVGGIEVDRERASELDVARAGALGGGSMARPGSRPRTRIR